MRSRKQFLTALGTATAAAMIPTVVRSACAPYAVVDAEVGGVGRLRTISFAPTANCAAVTMVAALLDGNKARATVVADALPQMAVSRKEPFANDCHPTIYHPGALDIRLICPNVPAPEDKDDLVAMRLVAERYDAATQLSGIAQRHGALIAINGGYFDRSSFDPKGLVVIDGKIVSPVDPDLPGAFVADEHGAPSIVRSADAARRPFALQGGPFLLDFAGTVGAPLDEQAVARRTFVAQSGSTFVAASTSEIDLHGLANLLALYPEAFGVGYFDAALNLGGGGTSGFFGRADDTILSRAASIRSANAILFGLSGRSA